MTKRKAIVKFCIIGVLVCLGLTLCFAKFLIPSTEYNYNGFYNAIHDKMGIDLNGGVLAVFDAEQEDTDGDFSKQVDATITRIERLLTNKGFVEATVQKQGVNPNFKIRIEVPGMEDTQEIFDAIGTPANIEFMNPTDQSAASTYVAANIFLKGDGISKVEVITDQNNSTKYAIKLTFTSEGADLFRSKAKDGVQQYMSIFSNQKLIMSPKIESESVGTDGTAVISSEDGYSKEEADAFALQIESGLYSVKLNPSETSIIPATMGEGALMAGIIALLAGLGIIFILMYVIYRDFGLLSNLSMLVYIIIFLFFLAVIDSVQLTLPGVAGIILSIGMSVDANVIIFGHIREEFRSGKRFAVSVHSGFNRSIRTILDANITTIIASGILYFLGTGSIKGFAITLFLGVAISMFISLLIMRSFAKLYLHINPDNAKRFALRTDADKNAEKEVPAVKEKRKLNFGAKSQASGVSLDIGGAKPKVNGGGLK